MNKSQKPNVISKIVKGISNNHKFIVSLKFGKIMKMKVQIMHHTEETIPKTANVLGIYLDLNHK